VVRAADRVEPFYGCRVGDGRSSAAQILDGRIEKADDFGVSGLALIGLTKDPYYGATKAVAVEGGRVVLKGMAACVSGDRVIWVLAGDRLKHFGGVLDSAGHGAGDVGEQIEREHAGPACQTHRRANAD